MKTRKIILIIIVCIIFAVLLDSVCAKIFNSSPLLHVRKYYNNENIRYVDNGLLVKHYEYSNLKKLTIFVWQSITY